jgi:ppGpp synthetase/RelA/SpoT-type nucleotidyltranferase
VALPLTGNQLKNLTTRLRNGQETPEDIHVLADVLLYYSRVLAEAHADIERLCAGLPHAEPMAPRVKTLKTTLEKLNRQPELRSLAHIRDLAGMRVVVHGTRADQDDLVGHIIELFPDDARPPKLIDRRVEPRAGYRAMHLEVRRGGIPIEIQVRTALQHRWAELFERTADKLGRGLRYGEPVRIDPNSAAMTLVRELDRVANIIDMAEQVALQGLDASPLESSLHELFEILAQRLEALP